MPDKWNDKIFNCSEKEFDSLAVEIFHFQYQQNPLYKAYADFLGKDPANVFSLRGIPFLPISFFKSHAVKTGDFEPAVIFESSGTGQTASSHHFIKDAELYRESFVRGFELNYGAAQDWCILGLLPSYLERKNSSLVFMVDELIRKGGHALSGFYLDEPARLSQNLKVLEETRQKTLLMGVTFALVDLAEKYPLPLQHTIIMETGGMKGRREEMVRQELHALLKSRFETAEIHSEYGMTELLSQAYSKKDGIFKCPPWMKVFVRDEEDPLSVQSGVGSQESGVRSQKSGVWSRESGVDNGDKLTEQKLSTPGSGIDSGSRVTELNLPTPDSRLPTLSGPLNIIDLANVYSCSFIATDDAGKLYPDRSFEVLGRIDNSDVRGCSLMAL
jgi:hypothetical protein